MCVCIKVFPTKKRYFPRKFRLRREWGMGKFVKDLNLYNILGEGHGVARGKKIRKKIF